MQTRRVLCSVRCRRLAALVSILLVGSLLASVVLAWSEPAPVGVVAWPNSPPGPRTWSQETVRIEFFYNGGDPAGASAAAASFASLLSDETGLDVEAVIASCEAMVVEHLGAGNTDVAPLSSVAYAYGHEMYGIEARLVNGQYGGFYNRGQIVVPAARGYTEIEDLRGTHFAAPSIGSRSGYMAPHMLISDTTGMTPDTFFGEVTFAGGHDRVIEAIYNGEADCGATYDDARDMVIGQYPDVYDVVTVLAHTENLPLDPWAFRADFNGMVAQTVANGIVAVGQTPEGGDALETIFGYRPSDIGSTQDGAYDFIRAIVAEFGLEMDTCKYIYLPLVLNSHNQNQLLLHGDFDTGAWTPWEIETEIGSPGLTQGQYHSAPYSARLGGSVDTHDYVSQQVTVPTNATEMTLDFWYRVSSNDPDLDEHLCFEIINDEFTEVLDGGYFSLSTVEPQNKWIELHHVISGAALAPMLGEIVFVSFNAHNNAANPSTVWVDDVSFEVTGTGP